MEEIQNQNQEQQVEQRDIQEAEKPQSDDVITMTKEELQALIEREKQREGDRRVEQFRRKIEQEKQREKMTLEERLEALEREIRERDERLKRMELEKKAAEELSKRGLPASLVDYVVGTDEDMTAQKLNNIASIIDAIVSEKVAKQLAGNAPQGSKTSTPTITVEQFLKMNARERTELYNRDPELYEQLRKQVF